MEWVEFRGNHANDSLFICSLCNYYIIIVVAVQDSYVHF